MTHAATRVGEAESAYLGAPQASISHHYDLSDEFFALWLDPTLTYSCALYEEDDEPLESAQGNKLRYFANGILGDRRDRVLDIGCGWGAMMRTLVEDHDVESVVGLTLSTSQARSVDSWADDRYDVRVENWADHRADQLYDGIVSIGAFEHFARYAMRPAERLLSYRRFFEFASANLRPRGRLGLQTNMKGNNLRPDRQTVRDQLFIVEHIFPDSELPWLSEIFEASRGLFEPVLIRNDAPDYARTCSTWLANLRARRAEAADLVGDDATAAYERYLAAAASGFERRHTGLCRVIFESVR